MPYLLRLCLCFLCFLCARPATTQPTSPAGKPRVLILTDISSLQQRRGEPDDGQSLIRLMLYTNDLDMEGLMATSNLGHGQVVRPELIRQVIDAYGQVLPNLRKHDSHYPAADRLRAVVRAGQPVAGPKVPVDSTIGPGRDTEASDWIIRVVDRPDPRPVWVCVWGGSADLAQALHTVRRTRPAAQLRAFVAKLRVHAIYDQDQTGSWLRQQFPDLFYILRNHGVRGMYRGGDTSLTDSAWVATQIQHGHGPLGALYVNYRGGDIWSGRLGGVRGTKEGDTPSFLSLLPNGLNQPERPELGGWGGRFVRRNDGPVFDEAVDSVGRFAFDPDPRMAAVYQWRPAWQADFQARLDWCTRPYADANHPPVVRLDVTSLELTLKAGDVLRLDAGESTDPDGDALRFSWRIYPSLPGLPTTPLAQQAALTLPLRAEWRGQTLPILLEVTDAGRPSLTAYKRVRVRIL